MSNDVQLSPEVIEQAKKLMAKKEKGAKEAEVNALRYPGVIEGTCAYDAAAQKYSVQVTCVKCGTKHTRFTSDLWQTKGACHDCRKAVSKEEKTANKAVLKEAMKLIREGKI